MSEAGVGVSDAIVVHPDEFFVGGEWVKGADVGRRAQVVNPSTEAVIADLAEPGVADAERVVAAGWGVGVHGMAFPIMVQSVFDIALETPLSELRNGTFGQARVEREPYGVAVIPYDTIDEAVAIANDSDYGLTGAVFTDDDDLALSPDRSG